MRIRPPPFVFRPMHISDVHVELVLAAEPVSASLGIVLAALG